MKIGYSKLGRSMPLGISSNTVGGDVEPPVLLKNLAERNPQHTFIIVGRNSGENPQDVGLPSNVINPWTEWREIMSAATKPWVQDKVLRALHDITFQAFLDCDHHIVWAGQHGTSNSPIPQVGTTWSDNVLTAPQHAFINYASYILHGLNGWRDQTDGVSEEIWLHSDARNYLKCRDLKWPHVYPQLGQFEFTRKDKHDRFQDPRGFSEIANGRFTGTVDSTGVWITEAKYIYSRLELCSVDPRRLPNDAMIPFEDRQHFGIFINEARAYVKLNRKDIVRDWVLPLRPEFMHGKWSKESLLELNTEIAPIPEPEFFRKYRSVKCTFTTPSSGSGWATTKPWEAFASGAVCFFHPGYDTQGHIIPTMKQVDAGLVQSETLANLARWLRVDSPEQLSRRVHAVSNSKDTWEWLAKAQWEYYNWAWEQHHIERLIEERFV